MYCPGCLERRKEARRVAGLDAARGNRDAAAVRAGWDRWWARKTPEEQAVFTERDNERRRLKMRVSNLSAEDLARHRRTRLRHAARTKARRTGQFIEDVDRTRLYEMHGGCCGICGEFIDLGFPKLHPLSVTHDHVVPMAHGGMHGYINAQPAHLSCNMRKNARVEMPPEVVAELRTSNAALRASDRSIPAPPSVRSAP